MEGGGSGSGKLTSRAGSPPLPGPLFSLALHRQTREREETLIILHKCGLAAHGPVCFTEWLA